ncbi:helix-turn-helix domain-containing protein [Aquimarina rhabdastrellae]
MVKEFKEFSTNAVFIAGTEVILDGYTSSKELGLYTFIRTTTVAAQVIIDGVPITLSPNQIVSLTPNQYFQFVTGEKLVVYQFNREFYCIKDHDKEVSCVGILFFGNTAISSVILTENEAHKFCLLHEIIVEELDTVDTIQAEMLRILLKRFIIKTTRLIKEQTQVDHIYSDKLDVLRNYNFLVETHFRKEHSVTFYAQQLNKSPKTLSNSFSEYKKGPLQIIHDRIILEAKRLLTYTDKSAKEISYELGFEDASHLSRLFKKHTGVSPSAFKKSIHNF